MSTNVATLFPELGIPDTPTPEIKSVEHIKPDAIVLVLRRTKCRCGGESITPNGKLLFRYGQVQTVVTKAAWMQGYNDLPREFTIIEERAAACESCFQDSDWTFEEFE